MKNIKWAAIVMMAAAVAVVWTGRVFAQDHPNDPDMEWLENGGPGPGPANGPGPGMDRPGRDRDGRIRDRMLDRIKKEDPERFKQIQKIKELADKYRGTDDAKEHARIEKELRPLVDAELKIQQQESNDRIERLEKKLARLKETLKKREENWDQVVDYTIKDITGQNDYLKFLPGAGNRKKGGK